MYITRHCLWWARIVSKWRICIPVSGSWEGSETAWSPNRGGPSQTALCWPLFQAPVCSGSAEGQTAGLQGGTWITCPGRLWSTHHAPPSQGREVDSWGHRAQLEGTLGEKACFLPSPVPLPSEPHALIRSVVIPGS